MAHVVRTSVNIGGTRLQDSQFTSVFLRQTVGWHHNFEIRLRQDANRGVLADKAKEWIGKPITIGLDLQPDEQLMLTPVAEVFKGIVTSIGLTRQSGTAELVLRGQSPTLVADDGPNTRSFTDRSLQEIVDEVLKPYTSAFPNAPLVDPQVFKRSIPFTVQYKESNFAFVARLANRYGEWFFYDGQKLFFGKPSGGGDPIKLDFGENSLINLDISVRATPVRFAMIGYDYLTHQTLIEKAALNAPTSGLGNDVLITSTKQIFTETPTIPINTAIDKDGLKQLAGRREQVLIDEMILLSGSSRNPRLKIGSKIEVSDNDLGENYGIFIITSLSHDIMQGGNYSNHFEAIPVEVGTPPLSTVPDPPFCETQLAKVTDVDDDKALGRVRVEFTWQEGTGEKSPWLRVASPYSGKDKGFYIIPEVDDQVLVAFENNHPETPYVLTGMYNKDAKPQWFDTKNRYKGFKSKGQNEWKFDDKAKSISINAPSSIMMSAGKTITIKTGGKDDSSITLDVGMGKIHLIAKTVTVEASDLIELNSQKKVQANGLEGIEIKSPKKVDISGTQGAKVGGAQVDIEADGVITIKGALVKIN